MGYLEDNRIPRNIYLKGRGDPMFDSDDLERMVERLVVMDTKDLPGDIVVDETYFDTIRRGKGWMWDDWSYRWVLPASERTDD